MGNGRGRAGHGQGLVLLALAFLEDLGHPDGPGGSPDVVGIGDGGGMQAHGDLVADGGRTFLPPAGLPGVARAYAPGTVSDRTPAMTAQDALEAELQAGYGFEDDAIVLGRALAPDLETPITSAFVQVPLSSLNKHGLIAGATGTGKTKSLQVMAEELSRGSASRCFWPTSRAT